MKKRFLCFVLACCMTIGLLPVLGETVYATSATAVPSGYVGIYTAKDLDSIRNDLDGKYILMTDIDLSSWGDWTPIGKGFSSFSGVFDGNGHSIKNMRITDDSVYEDAGLFSVLDGATIRNIKSISGEIICDETPSLHVGAVAGQAYDSRITQCANYVTISYQNGNPNGSSYTTSWERLCAGGIVGCAWGNTTIEECMNANKISGVATGTPLIVGGIVGWFSDQSSISNCFNMADLSVETGYVEGEIGGIVGGQFFATACKIENCYNIGQLSCLCGEWKYDREYVGGIAGYLIGNDGSNTVSNCYYYSDAPAAVGSVRVWIAEGHKVKISVDADACSYNEMQQKETYSGFDFSTVWKAGTSIFSFPTLRWRSGGNTSCTHKYSSAGGNICTVCDYEFEPELIEYNKTLYAAIENAAVRNQPYAKAGTLVDKLAKGEAVRVTHYFYNSLGSKWYKTENGNYIYSERLTSVGSGAKTYTLSFNANGSGVTNLPASVSIREGVRYGIPGAVSGVPKRSGYNFKGYSANRNAATAEYVPGKSIMLTSDLTLYAVWEKRENNLISVPGVAQNQNGDQGTCTSAATAVILARRLLVDGKYDETFTYRDVRWSCNNSFTLVNMTNGVTTYSLKKETLSSVRGDLNLIVNTTIPYLLDEHPEGIVVYFDYINAKGTERPHAIVLSDYEVLSNGKYQLYAYDSGSSTRLGRMPIEETWLWTDALGFTNSNTYEDLFAHLNDDYNFGATGVCVWYVDKEV